MVAAHEAASLEGFHDRRVDFGSAFSDLLQNGLFGKRTFGERRLGLQAKGESVGEQPAPAKDADRRRPLFLVETRFRRFGRSQRTVVTLQCVEESALGKTAGQDGLSSRHDASDGLVLLFDHGEMLRAKPLEATAKLVGGQPDLTAERLLVHGRAFSLAQGEEQRTFWPRESDRGRPDWGIPGCLGHRGTRRGPD